MADEAATSGDGTEAGERKAYEPPALLDIDTTDDPAFTAAGIGSTGGGIPGAAPTDL